MFHVKRAPARKPLIRPSGPPQTPSPSLRRMGFAVPRGTRSGQKALKANPAASRRAARSGPQNRRSTWNTPRRQSLSPSLRGPLGPSAHPCSGSAVPRGTPPNPKALTAPRGADRERRTATSSDLTFHVEHATARKPFTWPFESPPEHPIPNEAHRSTWNTPTARKPLIQPPERAFGLHHSPPWWGPTFHVEHPWPESLSPSRQGRPRNTPALPARRGFTVPRGTRPGRKASRPAAEALLGTSAPAFPDGVRRSTWNMPWPESPHSAPQHRPTGAAQPGLRFHVEHAFAMGSPIVPGAKRGPRRTAPRTGPAFHVEHEPRREGVLPVSLSASFHVEHASGLEGLRSPAREPPGASSAAVQNPAVPEGERRPRPSWAPTRRLGAPHLSRTPQHVVAAQASRMGSAPCRAASRLRRARLNRPGIGVTGRRPARASASRTFHVEQVLMEALRFRAQLARRRSGCGTAARPGVERLDHPRFPPKGPGYRAHRRARRSDVALASAGLAGSPTDAWARRSTRGLDTLTPGGLPPFERRGLLSRRERGGGSVPRARGGRRTLLPRTATSR